jgi:hypothetical protein
MGQLRLTERTNPLTGAASFSLWRVSDGRAEANGFASEAEARQWAAEFGWVII